MVAVQLGLKPPKDGNVVPVRGTFTAARREPFEKGVKKGLSTLTNLKL
jgi:hypothetical protein